MLNTSFSGGQTTVLGLLNVSGVLRAHPVTGRVDPPGVRPPGHEAQHALRSRLSTVANFVVDHTVEVLLGRVNRLDTYGASVGGTQDATDRKRFRSLS